MSLQLLKEVFCDDLQHAGVKGMKWGVRKSPEVSAGPRRRRAGSTAIPTKPRKPPAKKVVPKKRTPAQVKKSKAEAVDKFDIIMGNVKAFGLMNLNKGLYNNYRYGPAVGTFLNTIDSAGYR